MHRHDLKAIADQAMLERDFLPAFSAAASAQAGGLREEGAGGTGVSVRDLTELLWCSIDNDDSLDLDQLSAAELQSPGGPVRVWVAIADVDARVPAGSPID